MKAILVFLMVVLAISAANATSCQSLTYLNNFYNHGEQSVKKAHLFGSFLEEQGWKKIPVPVLGAIAVLQPTFPGVSPAFGHAGRVTQALTSDGEKYSFGITSTNQGCTVNEWHSSCHEEADCDDVSEWLGLRFTVGSNTAAFYSPPIPSDDYIDPLPQEPQPQLPAGSGLCTVAHLRLRREAGPTSDELYVVPQGKEVLDLDTDSQTVDGISYRNVEYTNPMGQSFNGWASDAYLGPCALVHYASDVIGSDEQKLEVARASEVSATAPVEEVPGWSIGVMSALGGLVVILIAAIVIIYIALRYYRKQTALVAAGQGLAVSGGSSEKDHEGFQQFTDVPTIAVMPSA